MKTLRLLLTIVTAASCIFCATILTACPYSIRDSAFIGRGSRVPFRLVFLSTSTTPGNDKLAEAVKNAAASWLQDSNVVARVVELDGPEKNEVPTVLQESYSDNSLLPAAILFSPSGEALELGQLELKDKPLDTIMELMGPVVESPLRRGLLARAEVGGAGTGTSSPGSTADTAGPNSWQCSSTTGARGTACAAPLKPSEPGRSQRSYRPS